MKTRTSNRLCVLVVLAVAATACAGRGGRIASPTAPRHPEFVYPAVPGGVGDAALAARLEQGWFRLQSGDTRAAQREFSALLRRSPGFFPAAVAAAYLDLSRGRPRDALALADRALKERPGYAPALAARAEALLALRRDDEALAAFEAAVAADARLDAIRRRLEVLRFKGVQQAIAAGRAAAAAGRTAEARAAYERAIAASPDSSLLYRELAAVERRDGATGAALEHLRKAVSLDPADAGAHADLGELLEEAGKYDEAVAAYRASLAIEPDEAVEVRLERAEARARLARLPPEYGAIEAAPQIARADLAALIGVRLESLVQAAPRRPVRVITDVRGHWAAPWITATVQAGILEILPNHTFQPNARVQRGELAAAVSRLLGIAAARRPDLKRRWERDRLHVADVPPGHLMYPAVSVAVAAGVLPLLAGDTFQVNRAVSGAEAIGALDRIAALLQ